MGFGPNRVRSLPDALAQVLARHIALVEAEPPRLEALISALDSDTDGARLAAAEDQLIACVAAAKAPIVVETPGGATEHKADIAWLRERR